jgi:menaquinone-dependent protoporphyrinogen oxidase
MTKVLVVYGSRHGGTKGIAERIGEVLKTRGVDATVAAAGRVNAMDVLVADAFIVGSGVYMGSWLKEPIQFLERNQAALAARPLWLFSSGPLLGSTAVKDDADPNADALGPAEGPGSGGRKKVEALMAATGARENRIFFGAFDPEDPPKAMSERFVRLMPAAKGLLPPGDFRNWDDIEAWARAIAEALATRVAMA